MGSRLVTMSKQELGRLEVVRRIRERSLTQARAADLLGVCVRQIRRLCVAFEIYGAPGLVSARRGKPSNRRLPASLKSKVLALVRERYADFGPTLAREKLAELHQVVVSRETLRGWLSEAGIWLPRRERARIAHQPRHRRACLGELVQIDGCDHAWFEERAPACTLLVYVDDATGRVMELRFVRSESAFDYFEATESYLRRHGKPVAFYSDKHSIFRVAREGTSGPNRGVTQFGRALAALNIDIICANTPQAKGRVERMNSTLQDRLVKELRLRGVTGMEAGNAFLPEFTKDYNRRFGRPAKNPHDSHRPLRADENLRSIFTWQEQRKLTRNLTVHFKRVTYLVEHTPETRALAGKMVQVFESEDGNIVLRCGGTLLPYTPFDKNPHVDQGAVVENKRLGVVLAAIQRGQLERDRQRLKSKLTLRQKERIKEAKRAASEVNGGTA